MHGRDRKTHPHRQLSRILKLALSFAFVVILAVVTACTAGPSSRPPVIENDGPGPQQQQSTTPSPIPLAPLVEPKDPSVRWSECDNETRRRIGQPAPADNLRFSCATVVSTLDTPDLPNRGLIGIKLLKVGAGPIPLVVLNDIDGEPGTLYAARLAGILPAELLQKFSLIGVDRRGSGGSNPVDCIPTAVRWQLLGQDPLVPDNQEVLEAAGKAGQQCAIQLSGSQQAFDSWRAAGDLEEIRDQLGMEKLHALSRGEGSQVLTAYRTRFADRVGRFVLDGLPDPSPDLATKLDTIAAGAQSTMDALGKDCAARGCALGTDAGQAVTALAEKLRKAPQYSGGVKFGPSVVLYAVLQGLGQRARWPELTDAIAAGQAGDLTKLSAFLAPLIEPSNGNSARLDVGLATKCNDIASRLPADQITKLSQQLQTKYVLFGGLVAQQLGWCAPWSAQRTPPPTTSQQSVPPMVVISTANDPVTPAAGTTKAAGQLPAVTTMAWQGAGHGAVASACVSQAIQAFFIEAKLPDSGTLCPA